MDRSRSRELLAGPVGVAVGAAVGGAAGLGGDLAYSGFAGDFVHDVGARLQPGGHAVVASVWEDWTVPVDVAVAPFAGAVSRQSTAKAEARARHQQHKEKLSRFAQAQKAAFHDLAA